MTTTTGYTYAYWGAATTSSGVHWASIRCHATSTIEHDSIKLGYFHPTTHDFAAVSDVAYDYTRTAGTVNLGSTGYKLALRFHVTWTDTAGYRISTVRVSHWCGGLGSRVPDEVPSQTTGGIGKTRTQGSILTAHDPDNTAGTLDLTQIPRLHGCSAPTSAETLIELGASEMIGLDGANHIEVEDGTNEANADLVEADGTSRTIRAAWDTDGTYAAKVGGDDGSDDYDGAWPAGDIEIKGTCRATRSLIVYDIAVKNTDPII